MDLGRLINSGSSQSGRRIPCRRGKRGCINTRGTRNVAGQRVVAGPKQQNPVAEGGLRTLRSNLCVVGRSEDFLSFRITYGIVPCRKRRGYLHRMGARQFFRRSSPLAFSKEAGASEHGGHGDRGESDSWMKARRVRWLAHWHDGCYGMSYE